MRDRKGVLGLSYERLAARCIDPETGEQTVKGSWLHRLATDLPVQIPDFPMLRGLAAGLDVPLGRVQDAAGAEFFGMDVVWSASGEARALVRSAEALTPTQREQLQRLLEGFAQPE
ncbi:XRE family transcriptional regulator [Streptomyces sp. NBC_01565]|uniref:XRE family transcriptional regulator n=1 Tax=Streptomyces sp. NBC_01565 TaxID=2975881 RepID=UPI00225C0C3D|nr:XRE family transcriptional regulator [Streptomyces sp. NBC_01565]MCX4540453.1 XRE family transcriptional regulator [Streptomyces sp. NBC_01565]